jgi:hypothetical protein
MTKKVVDVESQSVSIVFDDQTTSSLSLKDLTPAMVIRLALHGLSQKRGDSYAGAKDEADPVAFAKAAVADVDANLIAGDWRATSTGTGGSRISDFAKALAAATGQSIEDVVASLEDTPEEQQAVLKKHPKVVAHLARIKAEKAVERANKAAAKENEGGAITL